jgi:hypothetical protein
VNLCFVERHKTLKNKTHTKHTIMKTRQFFIALGLVAFTLFVSTFISSAQGPGVKAPLSLQLTSVNPTCYDNNDGIIVLDINGGFPPYFVNGIEITGNQVSFENLAEGPYTIYVSDTLLTSAEVQVTLIAPLALDMQAVVTNVSVYGGNDGAVDLTVNNPSVSYAWTTLDGSGLMETLEDQSGLTAGTYTVTITEGNGCVTSKRFVVDQILPGLGTGGPNSNQNPNGMSSANGTAIF